MITKFEAKSGDSLLWCKNVVKDEHCREISSSGFYKIFMFEPGIYNLTEYSFDEDKYIFEKPTKKLLDKNNLYFEAKSQEVIYIGLVKKKGSNYEVIDEFDVLQKAFQSKNYQELTSLFDNSLKEIEWLVNLPKTILKQLADDFQLEEVKKTRKSPKTNNVNLGQSCEAFCNRETLRRREKEIILDKEKYSEKYLQQLIDELNFDKKRCGFSTK